jgi:hypothetical protein
MCEVKEKPNPLEPVLYRARALLDQRDISKTPCRPEEHPLDFYKRNGNGVMMISPCLTCRSGEQKCCFTVTYKPGHGWRWNFVKHLTVPKREVK